MDLSYTQNMEDYHLSLAFAGQATGSYIDIGAGHPIADNVSFWFYERGWRGIAVEPQRHLVELYAKLRPRDTAVGALIGSKIGDTDFHVFDRFHGLSTTVESYARGVGVDYETVRLPTISLAGLCEDHRVGAIDILKVDVEGAEADVLRSGDWRRFRPKVVVVEAIAPGSNEPSWQQWEPFLLAQGYDFALDDTLNRFYVAQEQPEIAARMPRERAPWDRVRHMYEIGRAPDNAAHPDHVLAQILGRGFWSMLPYLDRELLAEIIRRGRRPSDTFDAGALVLDSDDARARLGRIACGYDGGQIEPQPADNTAERRES